MKLTVTQENLAKALANVGRIAASRNELAILNNILLRTDGSRLIVAATNLEIASTQYVGAKVEKHGSITIPARLVSEFVASLPSGTVELEVKDEHLHLTADKFSSVINGVVADEFPELPTVDEEMAVRMDISTDELKKAVSQTIIATSGDTMRAVLTGVYWHTHNGELYLDTEASDISLFFDETQVGFRTDHLEIVSRLIDGKFPDYRQLIPKIAETEVTIKKADFLRITKVASLFARESGGGITLMASHERALLSIHSIASELGENTSEASAEVSSDGEITLNSRYLIESLGVTDGETVTFSFNGKLSPCVIREQTATPDCMHIVMPLKR